MALLSMADPAKIIALMELLNLRDVFTAMIAQQAHAQTDDNTH